MFQDKDLYIYYVYMLPISDNQNLIHILAYSRDMDRLDNQTDMCIHHLNILRLDHKVKDYTDLTTLVHHLYKII